MDMSVNIAGVEWKNPVTVASGTFGSGAEFADYVAVSYTHLTLPTNSLV